MSPVSVYVYVSVSVDGYRMAWSSSAEVVAARRERMSLVVGRCMVYFFVSFFLVLLFMVGEGKGDVLLASQLLLEWWLTCFFYFREWRRDWKNYFGLV
jgi:hypothetical protein